MAPKKSKPAAAFNAADHVDTEGQGQDHFALPKSTVTRIAKSAVPQSTMFEKAVSLGLVGGSTVFINYLTSVAHDIAQEKGQKTITATHVLEAIKQLGWEDEKEVVKALKGELKAYRKITEDKKNGNGPPPKPRAPGARPFGRPPKATTSAAPAAAPSTSTSADADAPTDEDTHADVSAEKPQPAQDEEGSPMTLLRDDTLGAREDDGDDSLGGEEEEVEDDEEAYGTNEEDEAEEEEEEEMVDEEEEEREDRVGDGLEEDQLAQGEGDD